MKYGMNSALIDRRQAWWIRAGSVLVVAGFFLLEPAARAEGGADFRE